MSAAVADSGEEVTAREDEGSQEPTVTKSEVDEAEPAKLPDRNKVGVGEADAAELPNFDDPRLLAKLRQQRTDEDAKSSTGNKKGTAAGVSASVAGQVLSAAVV